MSSGWGRITALLRSLRRLAWRFSPGLPTSWSEAASVLRPNATQIARLTVAAVISYLVADWLYPGILDLTAPLTALLVVQASTVGTLQMGLVRVGAVLSGVLVAVVVTSYIGLSWWSLAAVIAASLILAKLLRLGDQTLEAPISAMLILAVSSPEVAAEVRVANTLIGTLVGVAFTLLVPVAIPNAQASDAVRRLARSQAALMDEIASTLGNRAPDPEEVGAWSQWLGSIGDETRDAVTAVEAARESRRFNPRALAAPTVHTGLRAALDRLERCYVAERAVIVMIGRDAVSSPEGEADPAEIELRRAFAVVLDDVAQGLRAFGDLIGAEFGGGRVAAADAALERTLEAVRESRAVLTEFMLFEVDVRGQHGLWMLRGSVLTALDQILAQLDLEQTDRPTAPWLARRGLSLPARRPAGASTRRGRASRGDDSGPAAPAPDPFGAQE
ncbi:aromatic acid exporter family protein [Herbiconiux sp. L3-i23]|uniref:FUSC family protein n=1 Tax=Herbiconiux sp. L3-i23 TaxID=2905871 RepID=UPI00206A9895|nr:aromatic acid exporter family protein [Herbiconiux sp. L3-i23]BDI23410.1 FUSC family protein [Herbiconiux sp. L3-i23]